jgi:hypothetical protein
MTTNNPTKYTGIAGIVFVLALMLAPSAVATVSQEDNLYCTFADDQYRVAPLEQSACFVAIGPCTTIGFLQITVNPGGNVYTHPVPLGTTWRVEVAFPQGSTATAVC